MIKATSLFITLMVVTALLLLTGYVPPNSIPSIIRNNLYHNESGSNISFSWLDVLNILDLNTINELQKGGQTEEEKQSLLSKATGLFVDGLKVVGAVVAGMITVVTGNTFLLFAGIAILIGMWTSKIWYGILIQSGMFDAIFPINYAILGIVLFIYAWMIIEWYRQTG